MNDEFCFYFPVFLVFSIFSGMLKFLSFCCIRSCSKFLAWEKTGK